MTPTEPAPKARPPASVPRAPGRVSGQRRYDHTVLRRLAVIDVAQRAGMSLEEIRLLVEHGTEPMSGQLRELSMRKLAEIEALIERAQRVRAWLESATEGRGLLWAAAGAVALVGYGAIAALQPDANFGRVLAAYGGVFIVGSLLWGMIFDGFRPDRYDISGAVVCLIGVVVIMYAPR